MDGAASGAAHGATGAGSERRSLWDDTADVRPYAPIEPDTDVEVLVVGGGITGVTAAMLLAEAGTEVAVVEARRIGAGTTGSTTGKVTSQHGLLYQRLVEDHDEEVAGAYGRANEDAIVLVRDLVERHGIQADLTTADAYVFTEHDEQVPRIHREVEVAEGLGLPAEWTRTTELPFDVAGAVRFRDQAQLHPLKYVRGLAAALAAHPRARVHEGTRVTGLEEGDGRVLVDTDRGRVTARHVVLATLVPIIDRGFEFARMEPMRTYGIAARVDGGAPSGMYISAEEPTRSIRRYVGEQGSYLVVVGDAHRTGSHRDTGEHDAALARYARERFGAAEVSHRWSAQDFTSVDLLPFVGRAVFSDRLYVATGFNKWGLSMGTAAAQVVSELVRDRDSPHAGMLAPTRATVAQSAKDLVRHNLDAAKHFVGDRVAPDGRSLDDIPPGGAGIVRRDGRYLAVSRDADGQATVRSAVCRHLGCLVQWNAAEGSWDCPCHGSRYDVEGAVLEGPAALPLSPPDAT